MKTMDIDLVDEALREGAQTILSHSQVSDPNLSSKDILNSPYLMSEEMIVTVQQLWNDDGVRKAYARSNEYQLLDCAA